MVRVDKKRRTRAGRKFEQDLGQPDVIRRLETSIKKNTPPKSMDGRAIYSGKWRSFDPNFQRSWWRKQPTPWICAKCGDQIDEDGQGDEKPTIDHIREWSRMKLGIRTYKVCCNGTHWDVVLTESVRNVLQDEDNLQPMHQGCNSSKNGAKDTDAINPQRRGDCPGDGCTLRKAR
jgi:hypothetical protein